MAFDDRRVVAGFSTGEYGVITLPSLRSAGLGIAEQPVLGELFRPSVPVGSAAGEKSAWAGGGGGSGGSALGGVMGLSSALVGGLGMGMGMGGRKIEKNDVVAVPRLRSSEKEKGRARNAASGADEIATSPSAWLWGKDWGWDEKDEAGGEVVVVRESESRRRLARYRAGLTTIDLP